MIQASDISQALNSLAEKQKKTIELQAAYFTNLSKVVTDSAKQLAEQTRSHLETLSQADSFTSAFQAGVKFEDGMKSKLKSYFETNTAATKTLVEDIVKIYSDAPQAEASSGAKKLPKAQASKAS